MKNSTSTASYVLAEQIRMLYAGSTLTISASVLAGILLSWSQRDVINHNVILGWLLFFLTISTIRLFLLYLFNKQNPKEEEVYYWFWYFLIGTFAVGTMWGTASFLLFPKQSLLHQLIFCLIIAGLSAGGISSLCPSRPIAVGFLSLVLLPLTVRMLTLNKEGTLFMAGLLLIFWAVTLLGAIKVNANITDNIALRLKSINREKILKSSEERYRHIFTNSPIGILQYDENSVIIDCNEYFIKLIGSDKNALVGLNILENIRVNKMIEAVRNSLVEGEGYYEGDYSSVTADKTTPIRAFFKAVRSSEGIIIGGVGIVEDFTEKKLSEEKIRYHASYDFLTGLPNRRLLVDKLNSEISRAIRHGYYGAILFLDIDNFKTINDSLGHSVGDRLLQLLAKRITDCIRQEDSAARMGGDEFVIILTELDGSMELAANKARGVAEEISLCLSSPCQVASQEMHITLSVGVSLYPKQEKGVDDILKQADTAMYRAKNEGRNAIRFFLPSMQKAADERLRLSTDIREALQNNEFALHYQPQVDKLGNIVGAEGLLRWNHPERGLILPGVFLSTAEETGLIPEIGQWVLNSACRHIKEWSGDGYLGESQTISINVSGRELAELHFVDTVIKTLEETGIDPYFLGIELTEGSLISTGDDIVDKIMALQKEGVKISVDDFGTGYSSLSYLKRLPLDTLKIDRSFVNDINDASDEVVLVDTIIMMARNLGMEIIAEGVESETELLYLCERGCSVYQGYYFSKPVPAANFTAMLASGNCRLTG